MGKRKCVSYQSIDAMQLALAKDVFAYAKDAKKASGRALGTFVEILTFYLIKAWHFERFTAIERRLPEFANPDITHNVEFSLHPLVSSHNITIAESNLPVTSKKILRKLSDGICDPSDIKDTNQLLSSKNVLRNACTIWESDRYFGVARLSSEQSGQLQITVTQLHSHPFAVFECKRVGVEEGAKKGPQTIEKAKQGAYVARVVSSLQKIRMSDGTLGGFMHLSDGTIQVKQYTELLAEVIASDDRDLLRRFTLTIGIVSNHGNWFTSDDHNKELRVLAQSYDWLLFLTDSGLAEFVTNVLLGQSAKSDVRDAFLASYGPDKSENKFTKVKMDRKADAVLRKYFADSLAEIETWFNVISPAEHTLGALKDELKTLCAKNWEDIHG